MSVQKYRFDIQKKNHEERLDHFLAQALSDKIGKPVSKGKTRALILAGGVHLNGKRVRIASKTVLEGARIEVYLDAQLMFGAEGLEKRQKFVFTPDRILFEDDAVLVVNKPAGLPTQPTLDEARDNMFQALQDFLKGRDGPQAYLGMHHRLDRDTSGVMIFAKSKVANPGLAKAFAEHLIQKTYRALTGVVAKLPETWTVKNYLAKDSSGGKRSKMKSVRSGGDSAVTDFKLIQKTAEAFLVEARPKTGRMHQIRVHLAEMGAPILGDIQYGAVRSSADRVMLHAYGIELPHPVSGKKLTVVCEPPEDFAKRWKSLGG